MHNSVSIELEELFLTLTKESLTEGTQLNQMFLKLSENFHYMFGAESTIIDRVLQENKKYLQGNVDFVDESLFVDYIQPIQHNFFRILKMKKIQAGGVMKSFSISNRIITELLEDKNSNKLAIVKAQSTKREFILTNAEESFWVYIDTPPMMPTINLFFLRGELRFDLGFFVGGMGSDIYYDNKEEMVSQLNIAFEILEVITQRIGKLS